jgi:hypothetical protein
MISAHFVFGIALILVTLGLCYLFSKENKKK